VIRVEDAAGNLITTDNGRSSRRRVARARHVARHRDGDDRQRHRHLRDLSHNVATTISLSFTASGSPAPLRAISLSARPPSASWLLHATEQARAPVRPWRRNRWLAHRTPTATLQHWFASQSQCHLGVTSSGSVALGTTNLDLARPQATARRHSLPSNAATLARTSSCSAAGFADAVSAAFDLAGVERATGGTAFRRPRRAALIPP
jgi:hypothetical protein